MTTFLQEDRSDAEPDRGVPRFGLSRMSQAGRTASPCNVATKGYVHIRIRS